MLEFEAYLVLNRPQHVERSAGRIVGVRRIAVQADGLLYARGEKFVGLLFGGTFLCHLPPVAGTGTVREIIIFYFLKSIVGI